jgi:hypothetical protein
MKSARNGGNKKRAFEFRSGFPPRLIAFVRLLGVLGVERFNQSAQLASIRVVADEPSGWTIESISLPDYCALARPISISPGVFTFTLSPREGHTPPHDLSGTVGIVLFHRGHNLRGIASVPVRGNLK